MKQDLCFSQHRHCRLCTEIPTRGFRYIETQKGEKYVFEMVNTYTLAFILEGKALVSCNEFIDIPFVGGQMVLWPANSNCSWESLSNTRAIVMESDNEVLDCDKTALRRHADLWLNAVPEFKGLAIKPRVEEFLQTIKNYLSDGITCPGIYKTKQRELSLLFRAYYTAEEVLQFFIPTIRRTMEFETFVMDNYLKTKGVKEFVDLSGMNLSTFNRKFKAHFNESPYQWLIKQKSKHIYYALTATHKTISAIAKEFHFADASHFNRYCKAMFGNSPSKIRAEAFHRRDELYQEENYQEQPLV